MPAHIVHGDTFLTSQTAQRIRNDAGLGGLFDSNIQQLQAGQTTPEEVITNCNTIPFLDPYRLITVEGVLATAERGNREPRAGRRRRNQPVQGWEMLAEAIPPMPPSTVLILLDQQVAKNNSLLRALSPHCAVHAEEAPTGNALRRWIANAAKGRNAYIKDDAVRLMEELIGPDLWTLDREIEKLSIYCHDRDIETEDVTLMVPHAKEANLFAAMDAITEGRPGPALQMLTRLMADGTEPGNLMGMIIRQIRLIALAKDYDKHRVPRQEWPRELGFTSDFVARKADNQARSFSEQDIKHIYGLTLKADLDVKTGVLEPALAVELLATEIATAASR